MLLQVLSGFFLILVVLVILNFAKFLFKLVFNSILGLLLFWAVNTVGIISIPINLWTILIVAFGGVVGFIALVALTLFGINL